MRLVFLALVAISLAGSAAGAPPAPVLLRPAEESLAAEPIDLAIAMGLPASGPIAQQPPPMYAAAPSPLAMPAPGPGPGAADPQPMNAPPVSPPLPAMGQGAPPPQPNAGITSQTRPSQASLPPPPRAQAPAVNAPFLPWPPPRPSVRSELTSQIMGVAPPAPAARVTATPRLSYDHVNQALRRRLRSLGFLSVSYFWTPSGFAVLTPPERIDANARPYPEAQRWLRQKDAARWDFGDYIAKLFVGDPGRYRMLLFIISDAPVGVASYSPNEEDVDRWQNSGDAGLAAEIRRRAVTEDTQVTLFVYEFELANGRLSRLQSAQNRSLPARAHLASLGL